MVDDGGMTAQYRAGNGAFSPDRVSQELARGGVVALRCALRIDGGSEFRRQFAGDLPDHQRLPELLRVAGRGAEPVEQALLGLSVQLLVTHQHDPAQRRIPNGIVARLVQFSHE